MSAPGRPLFQAGLANLNPWTEARVSRREAQRGPLLIVAAGKDNTVPAVVSRAAFRIQKRNPSATVLVSFPDAGHSLVIDNGWQSVARKALEFIEAQGGRHGSHHIALSRSLPSGTGNGRVGPRRSVAKPTTRPNLRSGRFRRPKPTCVRKARARGRGGMGHEKPSIVAIECRRPLQGIHGQRQNSEEASHGRHHQERSTLLSISAIAGKRSGADQSHLVRPCRARTRRPYRCAMSMSDMQQIPFLLFECQEILEGADQALAVVLSSGDRAMSSQLVPARTISASR